MCNNIVSTYVQIAGTFSRWEAATYAENQLHFNVCIFGTICIFFFPVSVWLTTVIIYAAPK